MKLNNAVLSQSLPGYALPQYDRQAMVRRSRQQPTWLHFGAGNLFRAFPAVLAQRLLNAGETDTGVLCCEAYDTDAVTQFLRPYDDLTLSVSLLADGSMEKEVVGSIAQSLTLPQDRCRVEEIFQAPSLQMVSFTITEKGYAVNAAVKEDMGRAPGEAQTLLGALAACCLARFEACGAPLALVSMDNCSQNGEKLREGFFAVLDAWKAAGHVSPEAYAWAQEKLSFPWSMIDKITPRPAKSVEESLAADGIADMAPIVTSKNTFIAPFVNAERPQYLVIEDSFPNGRPALEKAGVYLTDRETVNNTERMKVTTCLNPLHTAMSVYGCMLGYTLICDEMKDEDIVALIKRLGYQEGLPVVVDPKILDPKAFIDEVVTQRLPNPFMPDAPQRIATDTSQKVGIRFGETIKSYIATGRDLNTLVSIPLAIAGWLRYLLAVDDKGEAFEVSADPLKDDLQAKLAGIEAGKPETYAGQLKPILANASIFGVDLTTTPLADKIENYFVAELAGPGAVRKTLHDALN